MAWRSSGSTNSELIANMAKNGIFSATEVQTAMAKVDRANYVVNKRDAYVDAPSPIGHDATISAPHMHAYATEYLLPFLKPGAKVLDVGSGSGYLCAVFHHIVAEQGKVVGIDHIPELVRWSVENLKRDGLGQALDSGAIEVVCGDGRQGYANAGPYDAIHVGAAAPTLPQPLVDQLAAPGRMFIPVGDVAQVILLVDKDAQGNVTKKELMDVRYVPLTDRKK
ncbi:protein-L-isoaspartate O-methyltransferase [Punctularia strigosozonata HHB-11173 SS5]|uniref:protein-L-isoaspartate O-methyltransferase n=1 Tax=Punctularia strigosozonata (strain HHB-11173) TaxID=741275 RepID=UPI000441761D|nr:protein-L-isoaspartate O-methyltransferase [Punctularia strigosozonata HHB-11173 SS5]EIN08614.1 protein-L-isoaspartate O-methyltransferase [Punctularia strigosozonata HHB-11173 SS5]